MCAASSFPVSFYTTPPLSVHYMVYNSNSSYLRRIWIWLPLHVHCSVHPVEVGPLLSARSGDPVAAPTSGSPSKWTVTRFLLPETWQGICPVSLCKLSFMVLFCRIQNKYVNMNMEIKIFFVCIYSLQCVTYCNCIVRPLGSSCETTNSLTARKSTLY